MWTGNVSPVIRQKAKGSRPARNLARREARRKILPGFPIEARKFTLDEIREYVKGDKIICLLCGKPYRKLGIHVQKIHSVLPNEYTEMYGLPWRSSLICEESSKRYSQSVLNDKRGCIFNSSEEQLSIWRDKALKAPRRERQDFQNEISKENLGLK